MRALACTGARLVNGAERMGGLRGVIAFGPTDDGSAYSPGCRALTSEATRLLGRERLAPAIIGRIRSRAAALPLPNAGAGAAGAPVPAPGGGAPAMAAAAALCLGRLQLRPR